MIVIGTSVQQKKLKLQTKLKYIVSFLENKVPQKKKKKKKKKYSEEVVIKNFFIALNKCHQSSIYMEVEYSGGGVLIFSYLILIHQLDDLGGSCDNFGSDFIGCRFDGPPIAARLYLTNSAKRKRRKQPRSATDRALGRLQNNFTSMSI